MANTLNQLAESAHKAPTGNRDLATDVLDFIDRMHVEVARWERDNPGKEYPAVLPLRDTFMFVRNHPEGSKSEYESLRFKEILDNDEKTGQ